jgi:phosphonate transport system substrate-binding protein
MTMTSRRRFISIACALVTLGLAGLAPKSAVAGDVLRFAVTDVDGLESLQREFGAFKEALEKHSGLKFEFYPVSGRTTAIEAMAADRVDLVLTGPAEYVIFAQRTKAQPIVVWQRPNYFGHVVVLADGPIKSLADLKGKKVSFHEIGSTSRHLAPAQVLADAGLKFGNDFEPVFVKTPVGLEALQRGDLAALGVNATDIAKAEKKNPGLKLAILGKSKPLPDDLIVAAPSVKAETIAKIRETFEKHGPEIMAAILSAEANQKYEGGQFSVAVSDSDYDVIRGMYKAVGVTTFEEFMGN